MNRSRGKRARLANSDVRMNLPHSFYHYTKVRTSAKKNLLSHRLKGNFSFYLAALASASTGFRPRSPVRLTAKSSYAGTNTVLACKSQWNWSKSEAGRQIIIISRLLFSNLRRLNNNRGASHVSNFNKWISALPQDELTLLNKTAFTTNLTKRKFRCWSSTEEKNGDDLIVHCA